MNQREALRETIELARANGMDNCTSDIPELDFPHLVSMYDRIIAADVTSTPFSEAKIGRWLGWAQAAVVVHGEASLEDMKALNMKWSDK